MTINGIQRDDTHQSSAPGRTFISEGCLRSYVDCTYWNGRMFRPPSRQLTSR